MTKKEEKRQTIVMVDDSMTSLSLGKDILKDKYNVFPVSSGADFFALIENFIPDLVLLDILMPEMDGYEVIKKLKANKETYNIPVIFLTSRSDQDNELEGLSLGAIDYITKPFSPALLIQRIENHLLIAAQKQELNNFNDNLRKMVLEQTGEIERLQQAVLSTVAEVVEFRDDTAGGHIDRSMSYLKFMLDKLIEENIYHEEISEWDLNFLIPAAQLHDVGKIMVSETIMNKPGKLTPEEFDEMKKQRRNLMVLL
ncbi:hypothetical protein AGMMS49928_20350 [Spirochaetia bacterium]|nr:hypothetical protein AGMMS49928_20350 [Spirochaetia bacterium]